MGDFKSVVGDGKNEEYMGQIPTQWATSLFDVAFR